MSEQLPTAERLEGLPSELIANHRYRIGFVRTAEELREVQELRFEVFNLEMGEGLEASYRTGCDADPYDEQCHHLKVEDRSTGCIIGTYRMQTAEMAERGIGFYSANEFTLHDLPDEVREQGVEVGRACIRRPHRNGRVLYLLWRGLAQYLSHFETRYLFGCCSLSSQDPAMGWQAMDYLRRHHYLDTRLQVATRPGYRCPHSHSPAEPQHEFRLPDLFRLYLQIGAKVCSPPALDREFKSIDYLVILDVEGLDEQTRETFFK